MSSIFDNVNTTETIHRMPVEEKLKPEQAEIPDVDVDSTIEAEKDAH